MIPIEMWIVDMVCKYGFGNKGVFIKILYYVSSLFISIFFAIRPIMTNGKLFTMALFPLTQFGVFGNLAVKAINGGFTISFDNFNEPILEDFSMATVFIVTAIMMAALFLIFLYLIPLKV